MMIIQYFKTLKESPDKKEEFCCVEGSNFRYPGNARIPIAENMEET
jgi:hypothetical protein